MSFYNELPPIWALVLLLLAAVVYIVYLQPRWALRWMARQFPRVLWLDERAPLASGRKLVALTIDDAPSTWTANILDLLTIYDCRATFFVIGSYAQAHEPYVHRILAEGHEIGNHTYYDRASAFLSASDFEKSFSDTHNVLQRILDSHQPQEGQQQCQRTLRWFRPGSGYFHTRMLDTVEARGYRTVLGSVYPHDPQIALPPVNAWHIARTIYPGSIIIIHDRPHTVPMLHSLLPQLKQQGYEFVTVSQLVDAAAHATSS